MTDRNQDIDIARHFHAATSYHRTSGTIDRDAQILMGIPPQLGAAIGEQDPAIEPFPCKIYTELPPIALPRRFDDLDISALEALQSSGPEFDHEAVPDITDVARLCLRANGVLKRWRSAAGKEIEFRAAGCTGARYHLELYLVCGDIPGRPGLRAGVYHYAAHDHTLRCLRQGDFRAAATAASGDEPATAHAPVIAIWTSTFWRNAWRYQARAYRHVYWDLATSSANLLAVAAGEDLPARVVLGFADQQINDLLAIDGAREAAVGLVAIGHSRKAQPASPAVTPLHLATQQISEREIDFPEIGILHDASNLPSGAAARAWRESAFAPEPVATNGPHIPLQPLSEDEFPDETLEEVIARRRSNRHYLPDVPLDFAAFSTVIASALATPAMDCLLADALPPYTPYLIVNNVAGLEPGAYVVRAETMAIELLHPDDSRAAGARLACGQEYANAAHVNAYSMVDLEPLLAHFGNRGYRVAQFTASLFGAKLQLAAHALGLGAVGSTSFDAEVTEYFSPSAAGQHFMFIAVFGNKRRPSSEEVAAKSGFLKTGTPTSRTGSGDGSRGTEDGG